MSKPLVLLAALAAAFSLSAASPGVAGAATPCWKKVINDWSDHGGTIAGDYSPHCLRVAIKNAPEDLRDYSSIIDDISALLYDAGGPRGGNNGTNGGPNATARGNGPAARAAAAKEHARRANEAVGGAGTATSIPGRSRSVPLPLLILGAIGLAGTLAAASPALVKRIRTRFAGPRRAPQPDRS